jgi:hypothetical protein
VKATNYVEYGARVRQTLAPEDAIGFTHVRLKRLHACDLMVCPSVVNSLTELTLQCCRNTKGLDIYVAGSTDHQLCRTALNSATQH